MPPPKRSLLAELPGVVGRLALFGVISVGVMMAIGKMLLPVFPNGLPLGRPGQVLYLLIVSISLGLAHLAAAFWERSGDWEILGLGIEGWRPRHLVLALLGGLALPVVVAGVLLAADVARFESTPGGSWGEYALGALGLVSLIALTDALVFRGYGFGLLERRWGAWVATGVTAIAFAAVYAVGAPRSAPLSAPLSAVNVVALLATGLLLGAVRARTQGIAATWLAHLGLLWAQGVVLHGEIARFTLETPPMYRLLLLPPSILTGAGLGLHAGLAMALVLVGAAWYLLRPLPLVPPPPARP